MGDLLPLLGIRRIVAEPLPATVEAAPELLALAVALILSFLLGRWTAGRRHLIIEVEK